MAAGDDAGWNMEEVVERLPPLLAQVGRDDDQEPRRHLAGQQLGDDEPGLDGLAQSHIVGDQHAHARRLQGHDHRDELVVLGDDAAALQAEQRGRSMQQAEAIGTQQQLLGSRVTNDLRRWWLQTAGADTLEGDVEPALLDLAAINGRGHQGGAFLAIHPPQTVAVGDDGSGSEGAPTGHSSLHNAACTEPPKKDQYACLRQIA